MDISKGKRRKASVALSSKENALHEYLTGIEGLTRTELRKKHQGTYNSCRNLMRRTNHVAEKLVTSRSFLCDFICRGYSNE